MKQFDKQTYQNLLRSTGGVTKENLFVVLGRVQDSFGFVPKKVISDLSAKTGVAEARIFGALTSYGDFKVDLEAE